VDLKGHVVLRDPGFDTSGQAIGERLLGPQRRMEPCSPSAATGAKRQCCERHSLRPRGAVIQPIDDVEPLVERIEQSTGHPGHSRARVAFGQPENPNVMLHDPSRANDNDAA
jgi:hypothetical protein